MHNKRLHSTATATATAIKPQRFDAELNILINKKCGCAKSSNEKSQHLGCLERIFYDVTNNMVNYNKAVSSLRLLHEETSNRNTEELKDRTRF